MEEILKIMLDNKYLKIMYDPVFKEYMIVLKIMKMPNRFSGPLDVYYGYTYNVNEHKGFYCYRDMTFCHYLHEATEEDLEKIYKEED